MSDTLVSLNTSGNAVIIDEDQPLIVVQEGDTGYPADWEYFPSGHYTATAISMTSDKRLSFTPKAGELIWDSNLQLLYVGDGHTPGGTVIEGGGGGGGGDFTRVVFHDKFQ